MVLPGDSPIPQFRDISMKSGFSGIVIKRIVYGPVGVTILMTCQGEDCTRIWRRRKASSRSIVWISTAQKRLAGVAGYDPELPDQQRDAQGNRAGFTIADASSRFFGNPVVSPGICGYRYQRHAPAAIRPVRLPESTISKPPCKRAKFQMIRST